MELVDRAFTASDFDRVVAFRRAVATGMANAPPISLEEMRAHYLEPFPGWTIMFRMWESEGKFLGLGEIIWPDEAPEQRVLYARLRVHPDADPNAVGPSIVAWAEAEAASRFGTGVTVEITTPRELTGVSELLESLGYRVARVFERMERAADGPPPAASGAAGYRIRPLAGVDEVDDWLEVYHASFQDHYDFHPFHRDARVNEMRRSNYVPNLDLVAEAPDGSLASFCWTVKTETDDGTVRWDTHLVGTTREHRRRGLASALLVETIVRVEALGGGVIDLTVDSESETGANRVYERLGFRTVSATVDYRRSI